MGRLGCLSLWPGHYLYVGSAQGPGGLLARLAHHLDGKGRPHWHLDHLRPYLEVQGAVVAPGRDPVEHRIAAELETWLPESSGLRGFGSSDCRCPRHLFFSEQSPSVSRLRRRIARQRGVFYAGYRSASTIRHARALQS